MSRIHNKTKSICPICCDIIENDGIFLHKTRRQTHKLCLECGTIYLSSSIKKLTENLKLNIKHKTSLIKCPGTYHGQLRNQCKQLIDISQIKVSEKSSLYTDIFRISYALQNPNIYLCPNNNCGNLIETQPNNYLNLRTECQFCHYIWCRGCQMSPYHEGMSCLEYEARQLKTENGKLICSKIAKGQLKFCPTCRIPTEKVTNSNGKFVACNKILCTRCNIKWCWLCSAFNIDYNHYNIKNKSFCANKLWFGMEESSF